MQTGPGDRTHGCSFAAGETHSGGTSAPIRPITYDAVIDPLSWTESVEALKAGHLLPKSQVADMFLGPAEGTLRSRGVYVEGVGF